MYVPPEDETFCYFSIFDHTFYRIVKKTHLTEKLCHRLKDKGHSRYQKQMTLETKSMQPKYYAEVSLSNFVVLQPLEAVKQYC